MNAQNRLELPAIMPHGLLDLPLTSLPSRVCVCACELRAGVYE